MWDLLCKDFTAKELELTDIRDLNVLGNKIKIMIEKREEEGADPRKSLKLRYRKLHRKFELLHILFSSMDIHVFPRFLQAHTEGCKTAAYSEFDSALWLTGGYDGVIRSELMLL